MIGLSGHIRARLWLCTLTDLPLFDIESDPLVTIVFMVSLIFVILDPHKV